MREGILKHSKPREGIFEELEERNWSAGEWGDPLASTLEGQIVRLSDSVAYLNHDIADAVRAGVLRTEDLPRERAARPRRDALRSASTRWSATSSTRRGRRARQPRRGSRRDPIAMSDPCPSATDELRDYLFENVYLWEERLAEAERARRLIEFLWAYFLEHPGDARGSRSTRGRRMRWCAASATTSPA